MESGRAVKYQSNSINSVDIEINNGLIACRVFWARLISSESESLFTKNTKHTFYEIQYALEGRIGMMIGDGERVIFDESDFIVIPPDTYHQIVDGDTRGARFIMAFTLRPIDSSMNEVVKHLASCLPHRETPHMRAILSLLLEKSHKATPMQKKQVSNLVEAFLMEVLDALLPPEWEATDKDPARTAAESTVTEIMTFIHSHGGVGVSVADLAERFSLSQRHLCRLFVAVTGESPKEAINHEKLRRIEALVSSTALSLGEISRLCGFSDEYAMNKFFRRYNLTNLSDFRAIARKQK